MKFFVRVGVLVLMLLFLAAGLGFDQNTAEQFWAKGVEHAAQGNFNEAKEEFEKALKVDPFYESVKEFLRIIEDVAVKKIESKTAIHLFKGAAYVIKGQTGEAISDYTKAIEMNPGFVEAYFNRGLAYVQVG